MADNAQRGELFVGRERLRRRLLAVLGDALAGRMRLAMVTGEAGIGKTALVAVVAGDAPDDATVCWGTCWHGAGAPGYWPWTQALDALAAAVGRDLAAELAGEDRELLATIVPALGPATGLGDQGTFLLFDAVGRWLAAAARLRPVVIVLDDLHRGDQSSLALLDFLAGARLQAPLLVVGAYRHDELEPAAREVLAGLASRSEHLHLEGLNEPDVTALVASVAGDEQASRWAAEIHRRTGGRPFFVREMAALLDTASDAAGVPSMVRDAIEQRLTRLPGRARAVMDAAAVAGNELAPDVLADALAVEVDEVQEGVGLALEAGVLRSPPGAPPRFAHDLLRETLYAALAPSRRVALHRRIAVALERRADQGGGVTAAEVAHHYACSAPAGGADAVVTWALMAAEADRARLAFAEAAGHLTRARLALTGAGVVLAEPARVDLLVAEAEALARAGEPGRARELLVRARGHAEACRDPARIGAVAFGMQRLGARFAMRRHDVIEPLEAARQAVAGRDISLEAQLTAAMARELQHSVPQDRPRARPLSEHALQLARQADDPAALLACLLARHDLLWTPGSAQERLGLARDIVGIAERLGDEERRAEGLLLVANALLETGSPAFRPALDAYLAAAEAIGQPRFRYLALTRRAALELLDGRLSEAAQLVEEAARLGERIQEPDTGNVRMSQRLELVRAQGDAAAQRAFAGEAVRWWIGTPVHAHAVAAGFLARAGDLDAARQEVDIVLELGAWQADRSYLWSVFVGNLTDAAVRLEDAELCARILAAFRPVTSSCGVNGAVVAFAGSHAHFAGIAAAALGRDEEARTLLGQAAAVHARLGASAWEAASRDALRALAATSPPTVPGHRQVAVLRREQRAWTVSYGPERATVPDTKGWRDLAVLLSRPDTDIHVLELAQALFQDGSAGAVADRTAIDAYRRRLVELDQDRAEAERDNDPERRHLIDNEHEAVLVQLKNATGPSGRPRQLGTTARERARKAVSARIRDAIRRLEPSAPQLAVHLDRAVVTGTWCRYRSQGAPTWEIRW
ncbi:MAG TPA: AAA family ATPase [Actinomycetota bacterium]|nr:AAA family ATPase [Actinomycetota bacterium]